MQPGDGRPWQWRCSKCRYFRRPGGSDGLCGGAREDLPRAYGERHPLRKLPGDKGAKCSLFERWE